MTQSLEEINERQSRNSCDLLFEDDNVTISHLFVDDSGTISLNKSIDSPTLDGSDIPSPESKISDVGDMPTENNSSDDSASADASDLYKGKVTDCFERDEDKLGTPGDKLTKAYSVSENVNEQPREAANGKDHNATE